MPTSSATRETGSPARQRPEIRYLPRTARWRSAATATAWAARPATRWAFSRIPTDRKAAATCGGSCACRALGSRRRCTGRRWSSCKTPGRWPCSPQVEQVPLSFSLIVASKGSYRASQSVGPSRTGREFSGLPARIFTSTRERETSHAPGQGCTGASRLHQRPVERPRVQLRRLRLAHRCAP